MHSSVSRHDFETTYEPFLTLEYPQDNTKNGFLQLDDRLLVYRGADQPDMSVINPESDVWQHIKASFLPFSRALAPLTIQARADTQHVSRDAIPHPLRRHLLRRSPNRSRRTPRVHPLQRA